MSDKIRCRCGFPMRREVEGLVLLDGPFFTNEIAEAVDRGAPLREVAAITLDAIDTVTPPHSKHGYHCPRCGRMWLAAADEGGPWVSYLPERDSRLWDDDLDDANDLREAMALRWKLDGLPDPGPIEEVEGPGRPR